jgi:hypothetical protein
MLQKYKILFFQTNNRLIFLFFQTDKCLFFLFFQTNKCLFFLFFQTNDFKYQKTVFYIFHGKLKLSTPPPPPNYPKANWQQVMLIVDIFLKIVFI